MVSAWQGFGWTAQLFTSISTLDVLVIVLYFLLVLGIALWVSGAWSGGRGGVNPSPVTPPPPPVTPWLVSAASCKWPQMAPGSPSHSRCWPGCWRVQPLCCLQLRLLKWGWFCQHAQPVHWGHLWSAFCAQAALTEDLFSMDALKSTSDLLRDPRRAFILFLFR